MTHSLKLSALAAILGAALAAPAWSQPSTSSDPYDPSDTQLREQCLDTTTNTWKTTAQCEVFIRNGIAPPVVGGGSATAGTSAGVGSTSSLNDNAAISGSTNRSTTGTTSSLNPSMSSSGTTGTGTSGSTSGSTSGATSGSTSGSAGTSGATSGGMSGGSGH